MASELITTNYLFTRYILPFLLVFVLIYAVLEKTKLFGEGKKQASAIIALVIGLIFIAYPYPTEIVSKLMAFVSVAAVVLLVFMLLYAFASHSGTGNFVLGGKVKITAGVIIFVALVLAVVWATGSWDYVYDKFLGGNFQGSFWTNLLFIIIIVGALIAVLVGGKNSGGSGSSKSS